jgi:hypothetical protein
MGAILAHHGLLLADAGGGGATDTYYSSVTLLLHGEGSNHSTTFTDNSSSPKTPSVSGSGAVEISTSQSKYGSASISTNATAVALDYASNAGFGFGSGDYTLEAFVRSSNTSSQINTIFDTRNGSTTGVQFWMGGGVASQPGNVLGCSSNTAVMATGGTVSANTWIHCALCRSGTTLRGFVDGVQAFSITDSRTYASSAPCRLLGDYASSSGQFMLSSFLDEVRITNGVARYTANFTPPSSAFPNS